MATAQPLVIPVRIDGKQSILDLEKLFASTNRVRSGVEAVTEAQQRYAAAVKASEAAASSGDVQRSLAAQRERAQAYRALAAAIREANSEAERLERTTRKAAPDRAPARGRSGAANAAVVAFGQGLEDFSFGLQARGLAGALQYSSNNLSQFVSLLGSAGVAARATGTSVTAGLVKSLAGSGGLVLGLTLVTTVLPTVISLLAKSRDALDDNAEAAKRTADAYRDAVAATTDLAAAETEALRAVQARLRAESQFGGAGVAGDLFTGLDARRGPDTSVGQQLADALAPAALAQARTGIERLSTAQDGLAGSTRAATGALSEERRALAAATDAELLRRRRESQADAERRRQGLASPEETRDAERAQQKAERDAATAARRAERLAETQARQAARAAARDAERFARDRARLSAELDEAEAREGLERDLVTARQRSAARLEAAHGDAALRLRVEQQYQRDVQRLRDAEGDALVDRQLAALERVRAARERADGAGGVGDEALIRQRIDALRDEAAASAEMYADRATRAGEATESAEALADAIRTGTYATADQLALIAAQSPELGGVLDLLLERLNLEADLVGILRRQRIEREQEARDEASRDREREDRLEAARRTRSRGGRTDPDDEVRDAEAAVARAEAAVRDVQASIDALAVSEAEATQAALDGEVLVQGVRVQDAELLASLIAQRKKLEDDAAEARVASDEAATRRIVRLYEKRKTAALRVFAEIEAAVLRQRRFTDLDLEVQAERFKAEEKALRDSLNRREITQREYDLQMRQLAQDRSEFEKEVDEDRTSAAVRLARSLTATVLDQLRERAAGYVADAIAFALGENTKTGAAAAGSAARIGLLLAEGAADLAAAGKAMVSAAAGLIRSIVTALPFPLNVAAIAGGVAGLYGAYEAAKALFSGSGDTPRYAQGGRVDGPGGPTDDRVPALLSAGEHVLTAREVVALGGHDEVLRWRRLALLGQLPRFATGGPVLPAAPRPAVYARSLAPAPQFDTAPLAAAVSALQAEVAAQTRRLDATTRETAALVAGAVADPDAQRRAGRRVASRAQVLNPRGGAL